MLERKPRNGKEGSCRGSGVYAALSSSLIENRYSNQTQQTDQCIHRKEIKLITTTKWQRHLVINYHNRVTKHD